MNPSLTPLSNLPLEEHIFYTQADIHVARVHVRVQASDDLQAYWDAGWRITGNIHGPACEHAHTLPAHYKLVDQGTGPSFLGSAVLPDPCFWSHKLPSVYKLSWHLARGKETTRPQESLIGIRSLVPRNDQLILESESWCFQAAQVDQFPGMTVQACRDQSIGMVIPEPDSSLLKEASCHGTWVVPLVTGSEQQIREQLSELACWPCVGIALIQGNIVNPEGLRHAAPNLILGQWLKSPAELPVAPWSQVAACELNDQQKLSQYAEGCSLPLIAVRSFDTVATSAELPEAFMEFRNTLSNSQSPVGYVIT